jgi:hypothetical protein
MRFLAIGLMAAALAAAVAPAASYAADKTVGDAKSHADAMKAVPALIQQVGLNCTPVDAYSPGASKAKDANGKEVTTKLYEVACQQGLGWMIFAPDGGAPSAFDCLALSVRKPKAGEADKNQVYCRLPQNENPAAALQPLLAQAGASNCTVKEARWMGGTPDGKLDEYEVLCAEGAAYVLQVPKAGGTQKLTAVNCMSQKPGECQYFGKDAYMAKLTAMAQPANRPCQITDGRYIGSTPQKHNFYEVACSDGKSGYVLEADANDRFVQAIDCGKASGIGGGCQLTSAEAAQTSESTVYTQAAKAIGFNCNVKSYHSFGTDSKTGREVVELACDGHPESYIALLPVDKGQQGEYMNCVRAGGIGLKCVLSPAEATYAKMSSELQAAGKSCQVANARDVGTTKEGDNYVEAACANGPGFMLNYAAHAETVKSAMTCAAAKGQGLDCTLSH